MHPPLRHHAAAPSAVPSLPLQAIAFASNINSTQLIKDVNRVLVDLKESGKPSRRTLETLRVAAPGSTSGALPNTQRQAVPPTVLAPHTPAPCTPRPVTLLQATWSSFRRST